MAYKESESGIIVLGIGYKFPVRCFQKEFLKYSNHSTLRVRVY